MQHAQVSKRTNIFHRRLHVKLSLFSVFSVSADSEVSLKNIVTEMEQIETEGVDIVLNDAESGRNYYLKLNKEDSERVQHDEVFAQQLLNYAKNHHLNRPPPVKSDGNLKTVMQTPKRSDDGNTAMQACTNVNTVMQTLNRSDDGNTAMQTCTQSSTLLEYSNGSSDAATTAAADRVHWPYDAVFLLIQSMETNIENMSHPKKRKHVFENVCNDLLSKGFSFTYEQCAQKWKSLERSYKNAKDNKTKTGRSPSRFYFYDQMDNILGNKPTNSSEHTLESSEDPNENAAIEVEGIDVIDSDTTESSFEKPTVKKRKRRVNEDYFELKREIEKTKMIRHKELVELEKKKLEIEEKKIKVLEDLANKL